MISSTNLARLLWVLFFVLLSVVVLNSLNRWFDHDEFGSIHTSWKILQGEEIYVDFFHHKHPFFYYLLTPVIAVLGENTTTIVAIRVLVFILLLLILFVTHNLSVKVFNKETGIISLILLSTTYIFFTKTIEIRPDVPQTLFGLLSILLLLTFFGNRSLKCLILSSLFSGISFLFLQKTLFLIVLIGGLLLIGVYKRNIYSRDFLLYLSVFFLTIAPYYLYLFYTDSLHHYFVFNWTLNARFLHEPIPFKKLQTNFTLNLILWFFYLAGLIFFMKTPDQRRTAFLSLGLLVSGFFVGAPNTQNFMMSMPLIAAISAYTIYSIFQNSKNLLAVMLVLSIVVPAFYLLKLTKFTNAAQLKKVDYVLSITEPEDFVYDGTIQFNVFREDIDFFWFNMDPHHGGLVTYQTMTSYDYNIYAMIDRFKPKVISNYYIENMHDDRIARHYVKSDVYDDIFIRMKE